MSKLNVRDSNTGKFLEVDLDNPQGSYYTVDAESGKLKLINLTTKSGSFYATDANTGKSKLIDSASLSGSIYTRDDNTGKLVNLNLASPTGSIYVTDENTGKLVLVDLSKLLVFNSNSSGLSVVSGGSAAVPWYLAGGVLASNCVAAYQAKGAASKSASYINLSSPGTFDLTEGVSPNWFTASGWTFAGAEYLKTGIVPSSGWSWIIRFSNVTGDGGCLFGTTANTLNYPGFLMVPSFYNAPYWRSFSNGTVGEGITDGVAAATKSNGYLNGSSVLALSSVTGTIISEIFIGRVNDPSETNSQRYVKAKIQAIAFYNIDISAYVASITTAINLLP